MKHLILITVATVIFLNPLTDKNTQESVAFSGRISKGDSFTERISGELIFKLLPYSGDGWIIWIGEEDGSGNYCTAATPPYRGINAAIIQGWHFRNKDNTGPNDGSVNAPQFEREFKFVLDEYGYSSAEHFVETVLWPHEFTPEEIESASKEFMGLEFGTGKLIITHIEFGDSDHGERARLEFMEFEIYLENFH